MPEKKLIKYIYFYFDKYLYLFVVSLQKWLAHLMVQKRWRNYENKTLFQPEQRRSLPHSWSDQLINWRVRPGGECRSPQLVITATQTCFAACARLSRSDFQLRTSALPCSYRMLHSSLFHVPGRISISQGKQCSTNTDYMRQNPPFYWNLCDCCEFGMN